VDGVTLSDKIISYEELIAQSTAGFVGRGWLLDAIDTFLEADQPRSLAILGEPGSGKTSFLAHLVQARGYPHHFVGRGSRFDLPGALDWRDPIRFAESLGYQLVRDYGGWIVDWEEWGIQVSQSVRQLDGLLVGARVKTYDATPVPRLRPRIAVDQKWDRMGQAAQAIGVFVEKLHMDPEPVIRHLLVRPLQRIAADPRFRHHQVVIVVDALDEAVTYSNPEHNLLSLWPDGSLPDNVRFLVSARSKAVLPDAIRHDMEAIWLSEREGRLHPDIWGDAAQYLDGLVRKDAIRDLLEKHDVDSDDLIEKVSRASQGNFLYLYHFGRSLRTGDTSLLDFDRLPSGLYAIYTEFWRRIKARQSPEWLATTVKPVIAVLAVARAPLTRSQIAAFSGTPGDQVGSILTSTPLWPFLDHIGQGAGRRYALYHASFGEYVTSEENEDYVDARAAHSRIADYLYHRYATSNWAPVRDDDGTFTYALDHIVRHTLCAGYDARELGRRLEGILVDEFYDVRLAQEGWHMPFVRDLDAIADRSPGQVVVPAIRVLRGKGRNSLVNQALVRVLRKVRPKLPPQPPKKAWNDRRDVVLTRPKSTTDWRLDEAIALLGPPSRQPVAGRSIDRMLELANECKDNMLKGAIALALGETCSPYAIEKLKSLLLHVETRKDLHVSWCAADGLVALALDPQQEPVLVDKLVAALDLPKVKDDTRHRILYAIARRRAPLELEQAMALAKKGIEVWGGGSRARSIDLAWLWLPADDPERQRWVDEFVPTLAKMLGPTGDSDQPFRPRTPAEWMLKRVVTALGRIGPAELRPVLETLLADLDNADHWPVKQSGRMLRRRSELRRATERAIDDLARRFPG
jgi:hypothetical protein